MPHRHSVQRLEVHHGPALDVRALASEYILIGIDGPRVIVRRKLDNKVGTFRFEFHPLRFFDYTTLTGHNSRPRPTG